eukprot:5513126-Amphidinium_carterae.1
MGGNHKDKHKDEILGECLGDHWRGPGDSNQRHTLSAPSSAIATVASGSKGHIDRQHGMTSACSSTDLMVQHPHAAIRSSCPQQ